MWHGAAMRFAWLLVVIAMVGCSNTWTRRLEGRWFGESLVNVDASQLAEATAWTRGTSFEFVGSKVTITIPTEMPRSAPYEIVKSTDRAVTIAVVRPDGQRDIARMTLLRPNTLQWDIGDQRAMVLQRSM
jgi:hypothetical protein